jgi:hypothetical protein
MDVVYVCPKGHEVNASIDIETKQEAPETIQQRAVFSDYLFWECLSCPQRDGFSGSFPIIITHRSQDDIVTHEVYERRYCELKLRW